MKYVAIIDYGISNLFSVKQACVYAGLKPVITNDAHLISSAQGVILPGVGSFKVAMENLRSLDLILPIRKILSENKPFMGICLGFQLLFTSSEEFGTTQGLGFFEGTVKKFRILDNNCCKVPQIAWNRIAYTNSNPNNSLLRGIDDNEYMYFVHSFYVDCMEKKIMLTETEYGDIKYCSSVQLGNVFGAQFHPEKSAELGLKVYSNFSQLVSER